MATKLASNGGPNGTMGMHTAGIFADMTVDGPEIGTLVLIVDRAKNLPNKKTMGKQNPYCAARLGKEAKKTETDKRGGQTPRWDQELRFTVHDSPDYYNLKISVFSEDKRTDLIGEAWVNLTEVIVPGGGKSDVWQGLNCKGKYAGELRVEMTYYDIRPKPEKPARDTTADEEEGLRHSLGSGTRVKRRPLPNNPNNGGVTPDSIREPALPGRAKHGPRELRAPPRANSMPPETVPYPPQDPYAAQAPVHAHPHMVSQPLPLEYTPSNQYYPEPEQYQQPYEETYQPPDFLPELPPSGARQRGATQSRYTTRQPEPTLSHARSQSHIGIPHSHSAPIIPSAYQEAPRFAEDHQLQTDYPEPIPDVEYQHKQLRQRRNDVPPGWQEEYGDPYAHPQPPHALEGDVAPPPPPMHSNSAPVVPQYVSPHPQLSPASRYGSTPPNARHHSVPSSSPYGQQQRTPVRGASVDNYPSPPSVGGYATTPPSLIPGQTPSPYARNLPARPHRHSVADPYGASPLRPHPLSQEVTRARSPQPYSELPGSSPQPYGQYDSGSAPLIKPRAVSPRPSPPAQDGPRPRSSYSIQHPIRSFESSDRSPLSTSQPPTQRVPYTAGRSPTTRKSVSPRPSPPNSGHSGVPFSPDSFDVHNPNARPSPIGNSPHNPYQIRSSPAEPPQSEQKGPIVGWHGQEIDPSDHLPVDSWAPEPEKKTPTKTYGLGRARDFGPRAASGIATSGGRVSNDTVINVRMKSHQAEPEVTPSPSRNRLTKKNAPPRSPVVEPLHERHNYNSVPNPYEQQEYSPGFHSGGGYSSQYPPDQYGAPNIPPKVPMQYQDYHSTDALTREISSIDIGSGRNSRQGSGVPSPTAYVPVRSHRDRNNYY